VKSTDAILAAAMFVGDRTTASPSLAGVVAVPTLLVTMITMLAGYRDLWPLAVCIWLIFTTYMEWYFAVCRTVSAVCYMNIVTTLFMWRMMLPLCQTANQGTLDVAGGGLHQGAVGTDISMHRHLSQGRVLSSRRCTCRHLSRGTELTYRVHISISLCTRLVVGA